ncbi:unnamed protein product [Adineta steineri]|uniref:Kinesin light chain n=1 Tax=Adineta steineri TaxID=433720 RepID=A0A814P8W3_9BILA|nr:unnamed protein product [Adineta steineri]CAF3621169.1 unnamed protein product [Adineta steineri]
MLKTVNEFEQDYDEHSPIWWYTRECFISSIITRALRTMDMRILIKMGLFLRDISKQVEKLQEKKSNSLGSLDVYQCIRLNTSDINKLQENKDKFMSFNTFLLTTTDQELAIKVCSSVQQHIEILSVLFQIKIEHVTSKNTPFIVLNELSYDYKSRKDILFSMTSIFHISHIAKNQENIWQVQLTGTNVNDTSLGAFIEIMNMQTWKEKGWHKLGKLMLSMGEAERAEQLYKVLLEMTDNDDKKEIIRLYEILGNIKYQNGSYGEASHFFERKLQIEQKFLPPYHSDVASTYSSIGVLYSKMGKLEKALLSHQKALEIQKHVLPPNHPDLAITYDNIGTVNRKMGNYPTALSFQQLALQINEKVLPSNHPDLALNYNNIATTYKSMGNQLEALSFLQKTRQIEEMILPSDSSTLAATYDNIGGIYQDMNQYENAAFFYEKALEINEKVLHSNHPELSITYSNIGNVKYHIRDYVSALSFYHKARRIRQISLPPNHPLTADAYIDIGTVYQDMRQFSVALTFYEEALQMQHISLPHDHPDLVLTYMHLGSVHYMTGKYSTALMYYERGLDIGEVSLPDNHKRMKILRQNIALIEKEL